MPLARERRLKLGGVQVRLTIDEAQARRLRDSALYQRVVRPMIGRASAARGTPAQSAATSATSEHMPPSRTEQRPQPAAADTDLAARVNALEWYHVMQLPGGVLTPGRADHRDEVHLYGLPESMAGLRALDIATFDGYWAFEMERRGAETMAVDIGSWGELDLPLRWREGMKPEQDVETGASFRLAKQVLGSRVERQPISVYDLTPADVGLFDVAFISDLLQHLRDPQAALEAVFTVVKPGGCLILAEEYSGDLDRFKDAALVECKLYAGYTWQIGTPAAFRLMLDVAGFDAIEEISRFRLKYHGSYDADKVVLKAHRAVAPK